MAIIGSASTALHQPVSMRHPNHLLRQARLRLPSPFVPGRPLSRQELAEAVNAYVFETTKRIYAMDAHYVGRLERGARRWPNAGYRAGFRAVLGVDTDAELGFFRTQRIADEALVEGITLSTPMLEGTMPMRLVVTQLVVKPGMTVIVVPVGHPVLLALVGGMEPGG